MYMGGGGYLKFAWHINWVVWTNFFLILGSLSTWYTEGSAVECDNGVSVSEESSSNFAPTS